MKDNKYIKILKKAKEHYKKHQDFICWSIIDTTSENNKAGREIRDYIHDAMNSNTDTRSMRKFIEVYSLDSWLIVNHIAKQKDLTKENMLQYRLRYFDHLMEVFK